VSIRSSKSQNFPEPEMVINSILVVIVDQRQIRLPGTPNPFYILISKRKLHHNLESPASTDERQHDQERSYLTPICDQIEPLKDSTAKPMNLLSRGKEPPHMTHRDSRTFRVITVTTTWLVRTRPGSRVHSLSAPYTNFFYPPTASPVKYTYILITY